MLTEQSVETENSLLSQGLQCGLPYVTDAQISEIYSIYTISIYFAELLLSLIFLKYRKAEQS